MTLSIVTISFNQGEFLREAVNSVLSQNVGCEYIVVDPGSTDGSRDLLNEYRRHLTALLTGPDEGPADGLNKGFAMATGQFFGYINADDFYLPGTLESAAKTLTTAPVDVVYGDGWFVDAQGRRVRHVTSTNFSPRRYAYGGTTVLQQATFLRADAFRRVKGFNARNRVSWDGELLVDIGLRGGRFGHVAADWGAFRIHPASITGSGRLAVEYEETERRLFQKIQGRKRSKLDELVGVPAARVAKYLDSPHSLSEAVRARVEVGISGSTWGVVKRLNKHL